MLKTLITKQIPFHLVVILLLAFTMASHSRGLWPGDGWWGRSGYFFTRFTLESILFLGTYYLLNVIPFKLGSVLKLAIAFMISWPVFSLSITMLDIVMGQPELSGALNDKSRLASEMIDEMMWILPKHLSFCALVALINFRLDHEELFNFRFNLHKPITQEVMRPNEPFTLSPLHNLISHQIRESLLRIQAQEHYTKVTTCLGSELVLYQFGQALVDLEDQPGFQVHRSFWVASENVLGWIKDNSSIKLKLKFGEDVPVSRRFEEKVKNEFKQLESI